MRLTNHARTRSQQRSIRDERIDLALQHGRPVKSFKDTAYVLDDRALRQAPEEVRRKADRLRGLCVILAGDRTVRTVQWLWEVRRRPGLLRRQRLAA